MAQGSANRFDNAAKEWDHKPTRLILAENVAKAITTHLPLSPSMELLDFGAGTGLVSLEILPRVHSITAVDTSSKMLEVLDSKEAEGITTRCMDLLTEEIEQRFDAVISSMVMHHVPDTRRLFERIHTLLKEGGRIAFADLYKEDGSFHDDNTGVHHFGFEPEALHILLEAAGFTDIAFHTAHVFKKEREYPVFLMTAQKA